MVPEWAIFAPVFIPIFARLGVAPRTVLAAYRIGDSPTNVITALVVYLPFIAAVTQRYVRTAGIGQTQDEGDRSCASGRVGHRHPIVRPRTTAPRAGYKVRRTASPKRCTVVANTRHSWEKLP